MTQALSRGQPEAARNGERMRRREMIAMLGGTAVAWPRAIMAQPARPVIGYLSASRSDVFSSSTQGFRDGLKELGYVDGGNLHIEYRWAENRYASPPGDGSRRSSAGMSL